MPSAGTAVPATGHDCGSGGEGGHAFGSWCWYGGCEGGCARASACVSFKNKTKPQVLHAESNAIAKLARSNDSGLGADLFITHSPCIECAKLIYQSEDGKSDRYNTTIR